VINFQLSSELCVDVGLTLGNYFMRRGGDSVWHDHQVIATILKNHSSSATIMSDCLAFLSCCPRHLHKFFGDKAYLDVYMHMFTLDLEERDIREIFVILYHVMPAGGPELDYFKGTNILELILRWRHPNSMMLLTKVTCVAEIATAARQSEAVDWCFELLANRETEIVLVEAVFVALTNIVRFAEEVPDGIAWPPERLAVRLFETGVPVVLATHRQNPDVMARAFQLFAECLPQGIEAALQGKVIALASVLLLTNMEQPKFAFVLVCFLWACADNGLVPQLRAVEKALPNVLKAMDKYIDEPQIMEKCVGIVLLLEHPKRFEWLQMAIRRCPKSPFLKQLSMRSDVQQFVKKQMETLA
jgi:hypothetical protein